MCGIFGVVYRDGATLPDETLLQASLDALQHRGPDSCGTHREPGIALAHTRLSLLDLSERGRQPFWDATGRYCLVYNGEIYNFAELRRDLEARGAEFRSSSDTEVLLHGIILDGFEATLPKIEGMFAFAFYDKEARTLQLARDRLGIKPLFVYEDDTRFVFASEIRALRGWVDLRGNPFQISSYLLGHGGPAQGDSFYQGVRIVPPGEAITLEFGKESRCERYFRITDMIDLDEMARLDGLSELQMVDLVDDLLQRSVEKMLVADTPVGALCSGGVDSSVLMAMAARNHGDLAIFHANVVGPESEYDAALALSKHLDLDLKVVEVVDQDFIDLLPQVTQHYGHPFAYHPNSVPFLAVSKLVQEHGVKAVVSGEGSDECFLGYPALAQQPMKLGYGRLLDRAKRLVRMIPAVGKHLWPDPGGPKPLIAAMLNDFERPREEAEIRGRWAAAVGKGPGDWNVRTPLWLSYHLRTTLHRNDCLGMAASLEARFPFLDEDVVRASVNLPHRVKIRFSPFSWERVHPLLRDKWVLRKVADRYLPRSLSRRKKLGFPVNAWGRMNLPEAYFRDSFVSNFFQLSDASVRHLVESADQQTKVMLLLLDAWGEICLGATSADQLLAKLHRHLSVRPL